MPSFSKLLTTLTGFGFGYYRDPRHAAHHFGQQGLTSTTTQPRLGFQYFVSINLTGEGAALLRDGRYRLDSEFAELFPMVKSVELPTIKIDTDKINEYNRHRITQTKVNFDPVRMIFHDTVDGRTMRFWQMYYEYYFKDGLNTNKEINTSVYPKKYSESFGYNLSNVGNAKYLIDNIEIVQVHGSRYNKVTLHNPRISIFDPSTHAYDSSDLMEVSLTFEYEYATFEYLNERLDFSDDDVITTGVGAGTNFFNYGEFMDLPSLAISANISETLRSVNPLLKSNNPIVQRVGRNLQSSIDNVVGTKVSGVVRNVSASALDGLASIDPKPVNSTPSLPAKPRSFGSAKSPASSFIDVARGK